jgi:Domain of unknown function (DUF4270)
MAIGLLNLFLISCKDKSLSVPINPSVNAKVVFTDTFTVKLSTVLIDSLPTSNSTRLIAGAYNNNKVGKVTAGTYFQLSLNGTDRDKDGVEDILVYTETPVYDSITLILNEEYSYGDTTNPYTISIHEITDIMQYPNGVALYNSSSFKYNPAIKDTTFKIQSFPDHHVHIRLPQPFGQNLFSMAQSGDYRIRTNTSFMDYFRGLAIISDPSNETIYGFSLNPVMRLYYHDSADPFTELSYDFVYKTGNIHFNAITNDRASTPVEPLKNIYDEINSSQTTNGEAYLLTGINLFPKIQIPYLHNIKKIYPKVFLSKATLVITPEKNSYDRNFYPATLLSLYQTDINNIPTSIINYSNSSQAEVISPYIDWEKEENTNYTFDVTNFISSQLNDTLNNTVSTKALILGSNPVLSGGRAETLILNANSVTSQPIKLKLYFSVFY